MYRAFEPLLDGAVDAAIERGHLPAGHRVPCRLEEPEDPAFGDATSRVAIAIARRAGRPPEPLAQLLVAHVDDPRGWLDAAEAAGPGFVNLRVSLAYWRAALEESTACAPARPALGRAVVATDGPEASPRSRLVADALARLLGAAGYEVEAGSGGANVVGAIADAAAVRRVVVVGETAPAMVHRTKAAFAAAGGRAGVVAALGVGPLRVGHRGRAIEPAAVLQEPAARFALLAAPAAEPAALDLDRLASDRVDNPWVVVRHALARIGRLVERGAPFAPSLDRLGESERPCLRAVGMESDVREAAARRLEIDAMAAYALELAQTFHRYYNRGAYAARDTDPARRLLARGVERALAGVLDVLVPGGVRS